LPYVSRTRPSVRQGYCGHYRGAYGYAKLNTRLNLFPHAASHGFPVTAGLFYATADEAVAYMLYRCFFVSFLLFPSAKNIRQPFSGTAERIFMKLSPNDTGENGVCNVVPPPGE